MLSFVDRQAYFVIYVGSSRNWICRFHFKELGEGKLELSTGPAFETKRVQDIFSHKEEPIEALEGRMTAKKGKS